MKKEFELMETMTRYIDDVDERIRRMRRRIRNEPDAETGEVFDLLNRKLVTHEQVKALSKSLWALVVSVNAVFNDVSYWDHYNAELSSRVKFTDDDDEE